MTRADGRSGSLPGRVLIAEDEKSIFDGALYQRLLQRVASNEGPKVLHASRRLTEGRRERRYEPVPGSPELEPWAQVYITEKCKAVFSRHLRDLGRRYRTRRTPAPPEKLYVATIMQRQIPRGEKIIADDQHTTGAHQRSRTPKVAVGGYAVHERLDGEGDVVDSNAGRWITEIRLDEVQSLRSRRGGSHATSHRYLGRVETYAAPAHVHTSREIHQRRPITTAEVDNRYTTALFRSCLQNKPVNVSKRFAPRTDARSPHGTVQCISSLPEKSKECGVRTVVRLRGTEGGAPGHRTILYRENER